MGDTNKISESISEFKQLKRDNDSLVQKVLGWLLNTLVVVLIGLAAWTGKQLISIESRMTKMDETQKYCIETLVQAQSVQKDLMSEVQKLKEWKAETSANRFTVYDGKAIWEEIARIRENLVKLSFTEPPSWFLNRVNKIDERLEKVELITGSRISITKSP